MRDKKPTWNTVKRLFTGNDIAIMRARGVKLDDYDYMTKNYRFVRNKIKNGGMPPKEFPQWTWQMGILEEWMENLDSNGFPMRKDPNPSEEILKFITLSEFLTGVDNLDEDPELAEAYYNRLWNAGDPQNLDQNPEIPDPEGPPCNAWETPPKIPPIPQATVRQALKNLLADPTAEALKDESNKKVAKVIILLWYTGAFINNCGYADSDNGTPENNQYIDGLAWRVGATHPMAYSTNGAVFPVKNGVYESNHYWSEMPTPDGKNTGLGEYVSNQYWSEKTGKRTKPALGNSNSKASNRKG